MYTIIMNQNKQLIVTQSATLYQRENLVDQLEFIYPQFYGDINLSECTTILSYTDIGNVRHQEVLLPDVDLYKENKIRATLPVTTKLSRFAGDVAIRLFFTKNNKEENQESLLITGECVITIEPVDGIETSDEVISELSSLTEMINELKEEIQSQTTIHKEIDEQEIIEMMDDLGI